MHVDALKIWKQLSASAECREAVRHYDCKYHNLSTSANVRKKVILKQGGANFDQKYCADDEAEKEHYRTDYYVSGYMDMHLKQNLAAFRHCFEDETPQHLLLVDFGCGPMTSALALAQILSERMLNYKNHTAYFGIDASVNMVAKANSINKEHKLFNHFKVVQDTQFDSQKIPRFSPEPQIIVLCFSFVLAPETFKSDTPQYELLSALANDWKTYIENQQKYRETRIIYLNPLDRNFHSNWHNFKSIISAQNAESPFCYTPDDKYTKLSENCPEVYYHMIHGTR